MKKWLFAFSMAGLLALTGCSRPAPEEETSPAETETVEEAPVEEAVSYTHLTLPTILLV